MADLASDAEHECPGADPMLVLTRWYEAAKVAAEPTPDAMTLATATPSGRPSARVVLYKGQLRGGVMFVTHYESRKGRELSENPQAALVFHFARAERQVRLEGRVERTSEAESDAYFSSRPHGSQLGAWASAQSEPLASRAVLEAQLQAVSERFADRAPPRPANWGGFLLVPEVVELWCGGKNRLHDRFSYQRTASGWRVTRLSP